MIPNDRIADELEKIRERAYRDQPDMMGVVCDLINLLQYAFCEHEWEGKTQPGTVHGPTEYFTVCKKCGAEKLD